MKFSLRRNCLEIHGNPLKVGRNSTNTRCIVTCNVELPMDEKSTSPDPEDAVDVVGRRAELGNSTVI